MDLAYDDAMEALEALGTQIGMSVSEISAGIWQIINAAMAELVRGLTVRRGHDPRDYVLMAFGGAGPVHAAWYASELGVKEVIIPRAAPTQSALGLSMADILHTHTLPFVGLLPIDTDEFNQNFAILEEKAIRDLEKDGVSDEDRAISYFLDMKYGLQYHTLRIPILRKTYGAHDMDFLAKEFDRIYKDTYGEGAGFSSAGRYTVNFIVQGAGRIHKVKLSPIAKGSSDSDAAIKEKREAHFEGKYMSTRVYDYYSLKAGNVTEGPAIIEARETTTVIRPGQKCRIDEYGNIILTI